MANTDTELHSSRVLFDVIDTLERVLAVGRVDCAAIPGHESSCECPTHQECRRVWDEADALLARIRGS